MGDRGNVCVSGTDTEGTVFLYTHWSGTELPEVVARALAYGQRWDDTSYLTRIIFEELTKDADSMFTGFGISSREGDWNHPTIWVCTERQTVYQKGVMPERSFTEYVLAWLEPEGDWANGLVQTQKTVIERLMAGEGITT